MKLEDLFESQTEKHTPDRAPSPNADLGEYITSAQVAQMCNCSLSRVRQFKMEKRLKAHSPVPGRRDNFFLKSDAQSFCEKERERTGRPPKGQENHTHGEDDKKPARPEHKTRAGKDKDDKKEAA